ncbi:MAG: LCP family protein [Ilumatobacter sp.]|uniref:LCP family protein n=1 Tax=Ilumatobacter sp. TaxID=1967498 RepID=UPI003C749383
MTVLDDHNDTNSDIDARTGRRRHFDPGLARTQPLGATQQLSVTNEVSQRVTPPTEQHHSVERTDEYPVITVDSGSGSGWSGDVEPRTSGHGDEMHRTGTGQLAASIVLPGAPTWRRNAPIAILLLVLGVAAPALLLAWVFVQRSQIVGLALDPTFLLTVMAIGVLAIVARFVAIGEVGFAHRFSPGIEMRTVGALLLTAVLSTPVLYAVTETASARSAVADVFNSDSGEPLFVPESGGITAAGVTVDPNAVTNILIVGGDAGPGRWGMRTDTMMIVTVHEASGRMALTSIPRNLTSLQFPPGTPLAAEFPNGFDDLTNALFTHVNTNPQLVDHYGANGMQPEAMALIEGLGYSLNVRIDDFALVNMQGFTQVIDAVGGVTLELGQTVPLPPSLPGERALPTAIGPGLVQMDGAMAIAYARSRSADSDYQRMGRQRQLLAALGSQISPTAAAGAFSTVTGVLDDSMRTSLSAGEFDGLLDRLGNNSAISESVGLAPPLITPGSPDYAQIQMIVAGVQQSLIDGVPSGYAG